MRYPPHHLSRILIYSLAMATTLPAHAHDLVAEMTMSAERFLDALDEAQRNQAVYKMSDEERENWHFLPDKFIKPNGIYGRSVQTLRKGVELAGCELVHR